MGTNYYWHASGERDCQHCKQKTPALHIGKSSCGWAFSLRIHPDEGITGLEDWKKKLETGGAIFDEYGDEVTVEDLLKTITQRSHPKGLLRHGIDQGTHGYGTPVGGATYDLCNYEFS